MHGSIPTYGLAVALLTGCGASVQPGLANGPVLGGTTPETRVHDAVANGRDACERSAFPRGEVLRGQTPPCDLTESVVPAPTAVLWRPPMAESNPPGYPLGMCPHAWPGPTGSERGLTAIRLSKSGKLVCARPW